MNDWHEIMDELEEGGWKAIKGVLLAFLIFAVLLLLSLLFVGKAHAAPPCDPTQPASREQTYMVFISKDYWQRTDAGWYAFVACKNQSTGLFDMYGGACRHGVCNQSDWWAAIANYGTAIGDEAKKSSFRASWDKIITNDCTAPSAADVPVCDAYKAKRDQVQAALNTVVQPPPPASAPTVTHRVKTNGTSTTRPAYALANGVRGTKEIGRADVGSDCDLSKPTLPSTGSDVWASFGPNFTSGVVALCSPK